MDSTLSLSEKKNLEAYMQNTRVDEISRLAKEILKLSREHIIVHMQFMDQALLKLKSVEDTEIAGFAMLGNELHYQPAYVLRKYKEEPNYIVRVYLHVLLHCVFFHSFRYQKLKHDYWNMATDLVVEHIIMDMQLPGTKLERDEEMSRMLMDYKKEAGKLTAERLYRNFLINEPSNKRCGEIEILFKRDFHDGWDQMTEEELSISLEDWKKISERIRADLKSFSKEKTRGEALTENLSEAMRERYDYSGFLRRFMTIGEQMRVNDDEFDYIYYTYGLSVYGNMPLVEPLEYADDKKIKEFVIAIDTSASCRGRTVQQFLQKTYSIMHSSESFFQKINIHIIQCDSDIQADVKITSSQEFDYFMQTGNFVGFGSTDFRPVFEHVDKMCAEKEFENLKGLIYFTDGYGVYPQKAPEYDVAFVFLRDDDFAPSVPPWAIKLVLETEDLEEKESL